jgi:predicted transcriptional regulator
LEQEVLGVLAAGREPMTPAQVRATLDDGLAYTTVMTALSRLFTKGVITRERAGRGYAYRWLDSPTLAAKRMRRLLDGDSDRAAVLARFVAELDPDDGKLLEGLLAENPEHPR